MFERIEAAPTDAILGLTEAFKADPRAGKINLSVGVYQDENGKTPLLECVKEAEQRLAGAPTTKSYLPISGLQEYCAAVAALAFGEDAEPLSRKRVAWAQTPGGTGALRVAADFIHANLLGATMWMSEPTWPNHPQVFNAAGIATKGYPYFDAKTNSLDIEGMLAAVAKMQAGDVILLHGCCHNPTGIDPTPEQWTRIADAVYKQGVLPLLDFAYQGFADGIEEDAVGLKAFVRPGAELLACSSFSKNFSLYRERVGAMFAVAASVEAAKRVQSQIDKVIRSNYSNPPGHGAEVVNMILRDAGLRKQWEGEVATMRNRINGMRTQLVKALKEHGVPGDYSFIGRQRGMFSFSGLTKPQVERLRDEYGIYVVGSGRINVAGLTPSNINRVAECIGAVVGKA
ncbi:MAG: aspartate/tyrosine/aromatic aminotransferase [Pirellulales bacterium]|nr:aspartate/tyrosine/aromatic aminotransferase [Pirellulales bacterium]